MDRPLISTLRVILQVKATFVMFRQTLEPADQKALDELYDDLMAIQPTPNFDEGVPAFEGILLSMMLFQNKELRRLWAEVIELKKKDYLNRTERSDVRHAISKPVDPGFGFDDDPLTHIP